MQVLVKMEDGRMCFAQVVETHSAGGGTVEPTWTSNVGVTHRLVDMPEKYLQNVARLLRRQGLHYPGTPGSGLYQAVCDELVKRQEIDEALVPARR